MAQRGKVLRDTSNGKGLISAAGTQYEFSLEGCWKSDVSPKVGMVVEFELNAESNICSASAVPENQLVKEQAELAMQAAKEKGMAMFSAASARIGTPVLVAWAALIIAWFFMKMFTFTAANNESLVVSQTFWQLLGLANVSSLIDFMPLLKAEGLDKGIYAFLAIAVLTGPAISQFWKDSKAHLGNCLPLVFMLVIFAAVYFVLGDLLAAVIKQQQDSAAQLSYWGGKAAAIPSASEAMAQGKAKFLQQIHVGLGAYVALAASAYLAIIGLKRFLVAKAQS